MAQAQMNPYEEGQGSSLATLTVLLGYGGHTSIMHNRALILVLPRITKSHGIWMFLVNRTMQRRISIIIILPPFSYAP